MLKQTEIQFSFHDTVGLTGEERQVQESKAKNLEGLILTLMKEGRYYDPYEIMEILKENGTPAKETSIRRALTNLCDPKREVKLVRGEKRLTKFSVIANNTYRLLVADKNRRVAKRRDKYNIN